MARISFKVKLLLLVAVALLMSMPTAVLSQGVDCGELRTGKGPWDYNDPADRASMLKVVEDAHFTPDIEQLRRGNKSWNPMDGIDYTLRRFPNHHRALVAMFRHYLENTEGHINGGYRTPECYFKLALEWRPNDDRVWLVNAIYLHKSKRHDEARQRYERAIEISPNLAEAHYNLGLLYVDMGNTELAREKAVQAYQMGYPLMGLKDILRRRGAWTASEDAAILDGAQPTARSGGQ